MSRLQYVRSVPLTLFNSIRVQVYCRSSSSRLRVLPLQRAFCHRDAPRALRCDYAGAHDVFHDGELGPFNGSLYERLEHRL
jgi:hypothetical protein